MAEFLFKKINEKTENRDWVLPTVCDAPSYELNKAAEKITAEQLIIPETFDGLAVTRIGRQAFASCDIKEIVIPTSITSIGREAFLSCGLTAVTIPETVQFIDYGAFMWNKKITIYVKGRKEKPAGWDNGWNCHDFKVVWDS
jgi:hypothetical protein